MEKKKSIVLGMAIAAVFLITMVGSASAATEITNLPYNANVPGEYYYLTQDLSSIDTLTAGINVAAEGITIDGRGYSITGSKGTAGACDGASESNPAVHSGVRIRDGSYDDVVIEDLEIKDFCTGIALGWAVVMGIDNVTVTGCTIHDNGDPSWSTHGMHMYCTNNCNITKNDIYNNDGSGVPGGCSGGGDGIFMFGDVSAQRGWYNSFTCNNFSYNTKSGFFMKHQCMYNYFGNNYAVWNGEGGIVPMCMMSDHNTYDRNNLSYNYKWGFMTRGTDNKVLNNTMIGNGRDGSSPGISISEHSGNVVNDNTVCGSGGLDIAVNGFATCADNTCDTHDDGPNCCPWNCDNLASVYYDFDEDTYYSNDPGNCVCANAMNTGSCCNPGLFNSSGAAQHCADDVCILEPGTDPSDCDPAYILNWMTYPYSTWENLNWSGPAAMEMMINHYTTSPSQSELDTVGRGNNDPCNSGLPYVDRYGMRATLNHYLSGIANYGNHATTDVENALHYICWWQSLGPGAVPAYQDYSNWMVVRGIRTDINPRDGSYYPPYGYTIYGFWINDPNPAGIGENSYKCVNQFTDNYYQAMHGQCDVTDGNWVSICEPPEREAEITLANSPARFEKAITPVLAEKMLMVYDAEQLVLEKAVKDDEMLKIVEAAINGVNVELVPYDTEFAAMFAKTTAGEPILVTDDGDDYYLVPFNVPVEEKTIKKVSVKIEKVKTSGLNKLERLERVDENVIIEPIAIEQIKPERTLVVVLVNAEEGSFNEASWVSDPVKYLPVSKVEALKLALGKMDITAKEELSNLISKPTIELVYRDASPYYPDWKITVNGKVFYIGQDGTVS
jgi:hypothetical protein